ncbi:MAG: TetR/AcrR family transcriptional regulator [Pseudonocardiales bacterium]|nr:TetR/AcrR family transcriptional regulator [Pseudonocardiales bacterium]
MTALSPTGPESGVAQRVLDAAERLFYSRGVQAVGIDAVVAEAGVGLKTLYTHFGSKDRLVEAYLRRLNQRFLDRLRARMAQLQGRDQVLAVFDALGDWFAEPGFSGCAFINVAGELHTNPAARAIAREHKQSLRALLQRTARAAAVTDPDTLADRLMLLVEGAVVTAYVEGDELAARRARSAAAALIDCAGQPHADDVPSRAADRLQ